MSTMKNHLCSFLSRLALCGLAVPLILLSPALVRADAIRTFDVSGTAQNVSGATLGSCAFFASCPFSGTFQVDTTIGMVESSGLDISLPGLPSFDGLFASSPIGTEWQIQANSSLPNILILDFSTAPTLGSLVGFTGGLIGGENDLAVNYIISGGSITPVTPVPEPSSLVLFASGMLVLGLTRRFCKKIGHPLSA